MSEQGRILVVDDDPGIVDVVTYALESDGHAVTVARDGEAAVTLGLSERPDLVVLDVMLPALSGVEVCRRLRDASAVPILMLSARDAEIDRVIGLEVGADDYLTKPFSVPELQGRVRAILRRRRLDRQEAATGDVVVGPIRISLAGHEVRVHGRLIPLTRSEFRLLAHLAEQPGRVLSRQQLMERLSSTPFFGDDRACDVHVYNLRRKIESDPSRPVLLTTVRGVGYRLAAPSGAS